MPVYSNPANLQTPAASTGIVDQSVGNAGGFASGFLGGLNQDYANQYNNLGLTAEQISNATQQQALDLARARFPNEVAASNLAGAQAGANLANIGLYGQAGAAGLTAEAAQSGAKTATADVQTKLAAAPLWVQAGGIMNAATQGQPFSAVNPVHMAAWNQARDILKNVAPGMPAAPDTGDTGTFNQNVQSAISLMNANTHAAIMTAPTQASLAHASVAPTIEGATARDVEAARATAGNTQEQMRAAAQVTSSAQAAQAKLGVAQAYIEAGKNADMALTSTIRELEKQPGGIQPANVDFLRDQAFQVAKNSPTQVINRQIIINSTDPQGKAKLAALDLQARQEAEQRLDTTTSYRRAAALHDAQVAQQGGSGASNIPPGIPTGTVPPPATGNTSGTPTTAAPPVGPITKTLPNGKTYVQRGNQWFPQ